MWNFIDEDRTVRKIDRYALSQVLLYIIPYFKCEQTI